MDVSIYLAKVVGLYMAIISLVLMRTPNEFKKRTARFFEDDALAILAGILALIIGILFVVSHNVWVLGWPVIITALGWISLLKGVMLLGFPGLGYSQIQGLLDRLNFSVIGFVYLLLGIYLCWQGFSA